MPATAWCSPFVKGLTVTLFQRSWTAVSGIYTGRKSPENVRVSPDPVLADFGRFANDSLLLTILF